jgi:hypothetical protein
MKMSAFLLKISSGVKEKDLPLPKADWDPAGFIIA